MGYNWGKLLMIFRFLGVILSKLRDEINSRECERIFSKFEINFTSRAITCSSGNSAELYLDSKLVLAKIYVLATKTNFFQRFLKSPKLKKIMFLPGQWILPAFGLHFRPCITSPPVTICIKEPPPSKNRRSCYFTQKF